MNRLELYNNVLYRKFFDNNGQNFLRQFVPPEHLRHEILFRIHNSKFMGHIGIVKTANQFRQRFHFPEFTETLLDYVSNCSSCLQVKSVQQKRLKTPILPITSEQCFPGDLMEVDVVGKLNPCGGYTHIISAMDIFSRFLFSNPNEKCLGGKRSRTLFVRIYINPATKLHLKLENRIQVKDVAVEFKPNSR